MKKMMLVAIVFMMAQVSMAAGLTREAIETRVKPYAERVERAKLEKGGDFTKDAKVNKLIEDSLNKITKEAGVGNTSYLIRLINNDSGSKVLATVARLSSIIGDAKSSASEVSTAKKALELLSLAGKKMEVLSKTEAEGKAQAEQVELAVEISERIAKFTEFTSDAAKKYAEAYEQGLEENMTPRDAMKKATSVSKKEISEKDLKECII